MFKIIYELNGSQYLTEVSESGGICSDAVIIWDERVDGELDFEIIQHVGCLSREGNVLSLDLDRQEELNSAIAAQEAEASAIQSDRDLCQTAFDNIETANTALELKKCIKHLAYTLGVL